MRKDEKVRESGNVGADVWSFSPNSSSSAADHLVVMVHGILGSTANWRFAAAQFVRTIPDKVIVHCSESNMHKLSLDGVDVMGERLAKEIIEVVNKRHEIKKISFVSHSVGGLVARYAIGRLYRPAGSEILNVENSKGTMVGLEAMNFITIASPHLGSRGNKQVPFLFGVTAIEKVAFYVIHWLFGRTGKHLFLSDNDKGELPLLLRMINDQRDLHFMSALNAFRRRVAYSNVGHDHIVGWRTSSIRRKSELPMLLQSILNSGLVCFSGRNASARGIHILCIRNFQKAVLIQRIQSMFQLWMENVIFWKVHELMLFPTFDVNLKLNSVANSII